MADVSDRSAQAAKKKKAFAFLKSAPKKAPTYDEDFDFAPLSKAEEDDDGDDGLDMFKKSKLFWPQLIKKEAKKGDATDEAEPEPRAEAYKHSAEDSDREQTPPSSPSSKRRKLSSPDPAVDVARHDTWADLYGPPTPPPRAPTKSATPMSRRKQSASALDGSVQQVTPSTEHSEDKEKQIMQLVQSDLANLDDDDDERDFNTFSSNRTKTEPPVIGKRSASPIVLEDSDDEFLNSASEPKTDQFAHFIAAARKKRDDAIKAAAAAAADSVSDDEGEPSTATATSTVIKIFVHSRIAAYNKAPFGCTRMIYQDLGPVRVAFVTWLKKTEEGVSQEAEDAIFLTWRGRRIYDYSSGPSLGWEMGANGKLNAPDRAPGFQRGGILLEAWTAEDYDRHEAEQERQRLLARGDLPEEAKVELDEEEEEVQEPKVPKIRLFLTEKDKEPFAMSTYADTEIRVLIGAYQRQRGVPADREIRLQWDGEWLDPRQTVEQADIEDRCTVDVYLK